MIQVVRFLFTVFAIKFIAHDTKSWEWTPKSGRLYPTNLWKILTQKSHLYLKLSHAIERFILLTFILSSTLTRVELMSLSNKLAKPESSNWRRFKPNNNHYLTYAYVSVRLGLSRILEGNGTNVYYIVRNKIIKNLLFDFFEGTIRLKMYNYSIPYLYFK